ncbi:tetratricopeptide repeat-containing sensor histidine kinase [Psychroserpens ponticola]|uniref:histidine kinase n=1 Tax=Psychroserpens ponticola TaxID=2932268 RepID=A0ABY7S1D6_9FLAO|nr:histidine kinase dimerization/phosphoacceptor domain -containing protein [Psychroserpens ponticola]WCO02736.1 ATP-binding protein [Psychroserpens ponticola]
MTKKLTLILLTLFCVINSHAQTSDANPSSINDIMDWLETHVDKPKDSTLIGLNSQKAIQLSKQVNNQISLAQSYRYLAIYHKEYSKLDSSLYYFNKAKDIYSNINEDLSLANIYMDIKGFYTVKANYNQAKKFVYKALELYEKLDNQRGIALSFAHVGDLLYYENNYNEAIKYCDKAIIIQKNINANEDLALTYRFKASSQLFTGFDSENALKSINASIELYRQLGETGIPMMASVNWRGNIYKYMEHYDEAIVDYQTNFDNSKQMGLECYLIPSLANIGHVYLMQGRYKEALPYNLKAIDLIKKTGRTRNLWENYMHVSEIYESLSDHKKALYYHQLYTSELESFKDNIILSLENEAQSKYEVGQKNATIKFQDEKISQQKRTKILYLVLTALLATILFGLFYYSRKNQKRNQQLELLNNELDNKNTQNELLLREIHHRVKNNLELVKSLIALQSAELEDSATKDAMIASQNRVQSMGIIHQKLYQGENLGCIDMKDYFINLGDGILDTFDADDKVKIECAMEQLELDVDTAVPIGLIVNELITNALKYAFPEDSKGKIEICLTRSNSEILTLKVVDNGIGKTTEATPKGTGFGTQLIKLLTQQLNGNMQENHENGTSVVFEFKIKSAA